MMQLQCVCGGRRTTGGTGGVLTPSFEAGDLSSESCIQTFTGIPKQSKLLLTPKTSVKDKVLQSQLVVSSSDYDSSLGRTAGEFLSPFGSKNSLVYSVTYTVICYS